MANSAASSTGFKLVTGDYILNNSGYLADLATSEEGAPIKVAIKNNALEQKWHVTSLGDNKFTIRNIQQGLYASTNGKGPGAAVKSNKEAYVWLIEKAPDGLIKHDNNFTISIPHDDSNAGSKLSSRWIVQGMVEYREEHEFDVRTGDFSNYDQRTWWYFSKA